MRFRFSTSIAFALGGLLALGSASSRAEESPEGPAEPAPGVPPASAPRQTPTSNKAQPQRPPVTVKSSGKKMTMTLAPQKAVAVAAPPPPPPPPAAPMKAATLKLAPSAAELESERKRPDGPPPPPKERDPRDATPNQNPNWPTHVDHTRGPGSPLGPGTAADRKGMMQEVSGPQQGVIRNRW